MTKAAPPPNSVHPKSRAEWRRWLAKNHRQTEGVWFLSFRKDCGPRLDYEDVVGEALCFGWIDSTGRILDETRAMLWLAPRRPRSAWSAKNKARLKKLVAEGRMAPAGLAKIAAAKKDGSWAAFDHVEKGVVPADLAKALATVKDARRHFDAFPPFARRVILEWVATAKKPETRAKRIAETALLAGRNERAHQGTRP